MNGTTGAPPAAEEGRSTVFRKRRYSPMPVDQARRQSLAFEAAWRHFGEPGPVIAFLNMRNEALEARPLHLAVESDEGLERVRQLLEQLTLQG
jgi:hypothetical protein